MDFKSQEQVDEYFSKRFEEENKTPELMDDIKIELLDAKKQNYYIGEYVSKFNSVCWTLRETAK